LKLTQQAKALYNKETDNHPTIHCNRFPSWEELSESEKDEYRLKVLQEQQKTK
jgi:hypothetical protein